MSVKTYDGQHNSKEIYINLKIKQKQISFTLLYIFQIALNETITYGNANPKYNVFALHLVSAKYYDDANE